MKFQPLHHHQDWILGCSARNCEIAGSCSHMIPFVTFPAIFPQVKSMGTLEGKFANCSGKLLPLSLCSLYPSSCNCIGSALASLWHSSTTVQSLSGTPEPLNAHHIFEVMIAAGTAVATWCGPLALGFMTALLSGG